jgi:hypothetical protein
LMSRCPATSWAMCGGIPCMKLVMSGLPTMLNRSIAEYGGGVIGQGW